MTRYWNNIFPKIGKERVEWKRVGRSFNRVFGPEVDRNFGGETMRPQTRWRAIRVSVFGRRPMSRRERGGGAGTRCHEVETQQPIGTNSRPIRSRNFISN